MNNDIEQAIYHRLRRLARGYMARERAGHTMQATDLVHNAYLRLMAQRQRFGGGQTHFVAVAALMMRRVLVNHALARNAEKRGAGEMMLTLSAAAEQPGPADDDSTVDILALNRALDKLQDIDPRMVRVVEMRYFSGATIEQTAAALAISPATVKREWATAKLWLAKELRA